MPIWKGSTSALVLSSVAAGVRSFGSEPPPASDGWTPGVSPTMTITENHAASPTVFAPYAVAWFLDVTGGPLTGKPRSDETFDPTFAGYAYLTEIPSLAGQTWRNTWLASPQHRRRDLVWGKAAGTVLPAGDHTIIHHVYAANGQYGRKEVTYNVADPNVFFNSSRTIRFSFDPAETWAGAPAADAANSFAGPNALVQARARFEAIRSGGPTRLSGRAGTYNENPGEFTFNNDLTRHHLLDVWGGTELLINEDGGAGGSTGSLFNITGSSAAAYVTVRGWSFKGGWNPVSEDPKRGLLDVTNRQRRSYFNFSPGNLNDLTIQHRQRVFLFDTATLSDMASNVFSGLNGDDPINTHVFLKDVDCFDVGDFFYYYIPNAYMLGCKHYSNGDSSMGLAGRHALAKLGRSGKGHTFIREFVAQTIYISGTYAEGFGGWTGDDFLTANGPQPLTRFNEQSNAERDIWGRPGRYIHLVANVLLGNVSIDDEGTVSVRRPGRNALIEMNLMTRNPQSEASNNLNDIGGRHTVRNNNFIALNGPRIVPSNTPSRNWATFMRNPTGDQNGINPPGAFLVLSALTNSYAAPQRGEPFYMAFNTFTHMATSANAPGGLTIFENPSVLSTYSAASVGSNVEYAPNFDTPIVPTGGMQGTPTGFRMLNWWIRKSWESAQHTLPAAVATGDWTPVFPYPFPFNSTTVRTTQADYQGVDHSVRLDGQTSIWNSVPAAAHVRPSPVTTPFPDTITVDFQAGGFRVQNRSGVTWAAGSNMRVYLSRGTAAMAPDVLHVMEQTQYQVFRPLAAQPLTGGVQSPLVDFDYRVRPGTTWPLSVAGTNSGGAALPVA